VELTQFPGGCCGVRGVVGSPWKGLRLIAKATYLRAPVGVTLSIPRPLLMRQRQSEQSSRTSPAECWPKHGWEKPRSR
jgi:hypothetical protein